MRAVMEAAPLTKKEIIDQLRQSSGNEQVASVLDEHQNQKILITFYADWCGPCTELKAELSEYFQDESIDSENTVWLRVERDGKKYQ